MAYPRSPSLSPTPWLPLSRNYIPTWSITNSLQLGNQVWLWISTFYVLHHNEGKLTKKISYPRCFFAQNLWDIKKRIPSYVPAAMGPGIPLLCDVISCLLLSLLLLLLLLPNLSPILFQSLSCGSLNTKDMLQAQVIVSLSSWILGDCSSVIFDSFPNLTLPERSSSAFLLLSFLHSNCHHL